MTCIKTGCHIYLTEYDAWAYGDAFKFDNVYIFRIVGTNHTGPIVDVKHFTVRHVERWWEEGKSLHKPPQVETIVATLVTDHGYEGTPV